MTAPETLAWLAGLQARFGAVLRTPLDASTGHLHPNTARYPAGASADIAPSLQLTAAERLSIYQRQYWLRLLRVMQEQYPLTMRLLGAWFFNQYAARFLSAHPPHTHDLGNVVEDFHVFLDAELRTDPVCHAPAGPSLPRRALLEAARMDAAYRRIFLAPEQPSFRLDALDAGALAQQRLQLSAALAVVEEHWPLLEQRSQLLRDPAEHAVPLGQPLSAARHWLLWRSERGVGQRPLHPQHARLLALLAEHSVGAALEQLERGCPAQEQSQLEECVQAFFADGMKSGFFVGWCDA